MKKDTNLFVYEPLKHILEATKEMAEFIEGMLEPPYQEGEILALKARRLLKYVASYSISLEEIERAAKQQPKGE